ncbi:uncharacterized protein METZ01_LOCUS339115, partial [marine metagenome]
WCQSISSGMSVARSERCSLPNRARDTSVVNAARQSPASTIHTPRLSISPWAAWTSRRTSSPVFLCSRTPDCRTF